MNVADIASGNNLNMQKEENNRTLHVCESKSLINKVDDVVLGSFFGRSRPDLLAGYLYHVGPRDTLDFSSRSSYYNEVLPRCLPVTAVHRWISKQ
ncbi:hypothetical protein BPAE_0004g00750 [Botrytis paeoniae]|uniref:Uncharacterized protein n=1 Tax=Botrytis paeoniae TaxID=278948 RepID=A0A4Z1G9D7_9HELO|nr:hypothetical protein BPAE_0004g00750 [Botrytis paeoniae]